MVTRARGRCSVLERDSNLTPIHVTVLAWFLIVIVDLARTPGHRPDGGICRHRRRAGGLFEPQINGDLFIGPAERQRQGAGVRVEAGQEPESQYFAADSFFVAGFFKVAVPCAAI